MIWTPSHRKIWTPHKRRQRGFFALPGGGLGAVCPGGSGGDPYFANVSLLLHMDGANGSTTFTDKSPSPKTVSAGGNAQISTAQSKFGGASCLLDGSGDYLVIPGGSSDFDISSQDLTAECFILLNTGETNGFIFDNRGVAGTWYSNWNLAVIGGKIRAELGRQASAPGSVQASFTGVTTLSAGVWYHIAFVRNGANASIYINGNLDATSSAGSPLANAVIGAFYIGYEESQSSSYYLDSFIDEVRITKGVARYTANFTPPVSPFPDS